MTNDHIFVMKLNLQTMEKAVKESMELTPAVLSMLCDYTVQILEHLEEMNNEGRNSEHGSN
jgi:hypothetical protein